MLVEGPSKSEPRSHDEPDGDRAATHRPHACATGSWSSTAIAARSARLLPVADLRRQRPHAVRRRGHAARRAGGLWLVAAARRCRRSKSLNGIRVRLLLQWSSSSRRSLQDHRSTLATRRESNSATACSQRQVHDRRPMRRGRTANLHVMIDIDRLRTYLDDAARSRAVAAVSLRGESERRARQPDADGRRRA